MAQVVLFTNDKTVSKGMVKYASNLSRESIIDVAGTIVVPQEPVVACTQSQVQLQTVTPSSQHQSLFMVVRGPLPCNHLKTILAASCCPCPDLAWLGLAWLGLAERLQLSRQLQACHLG